MLGDEVLNPSGTMRGFLSGELSCGDVGSKILSISIPSGRMDGNFVLAVSSIGGLGTVEGSELTGDNRGTSDGSETGDKLRGARSNDTDGNGNPGRASATGGLGVATRGTLLVVPELDVVLSPVVE